MGKQSWLASMNHDLTSAIQLREERKSISFDCLMLFMFVESQRLRISTGN